MADFLDFRLAIPPHADLRASPGIRHTKEGVRLVVWSSGEAAEMCPAMVPVLTSRRTEGGRGLLGCRDSESSAILSASGESESVQSVKHDFTRSNEELDSCDLPDVR